MDFNIKLLDTDDPIFKYVAKTHRAKYKQLEAFEDDSLANQSFYIKRLNNTKGSILKQGSNNITFHLARDGKLSGLSEQLTFDLMLEYWNEKCQPPWPAEKLRKVVKNAFEFSQAPQGCLNVWRAFDDVEVAEYDNELEKEEAAWSIPRKKQGKEDPTVETWNARAAFYGKEIPLKNQSKFVENPLYRMLRFNKFANKISFANIAPWHKEKREYWVDSDVSECRRWLDQRRSLPFSKTIMEDAAMQVAMTYQFHPIRDWLNCLKWDGEARLDRLLIDYAGSPDTPYVREVSKNTIIAAVARVYQPGCQHDSMLVLEGSQGTGKTSFVRILGGKHYADIKIDLLGLKDTIQCMQGRWILEASELEFMRRNEAQSIKRFLTLTHDVVRLPYQRYDEEFPRQNIFIGTVNPGADNTYLSDTEGNRRYWPVVTSKIDLQGLREAREQVFAEAVFRYKSGESWAIQSTKLRRSAELETSLRVGRDAWQEIISVWLSQTDLPELTGQNIASMALTIKGSQYDRLVANRISKCMRTLGYERKRKRISHGNYIYVWYKETDEDYLTGL